MRFALTFRIIASTSRTSGDSLLFPHIFARFFPWASQQPTLLSSQQNHESLANRVSPIASSQLRRKYFSYTRRQTFLLTDQYSCLFANQVQGWAVRWMRRILRRSQNTSRDRWAFRKARDFRRRLRTSKPRIWQIAVVCWCGFPASYQSHASVHPHLGCQGIYKSHR